MRYQHQESENIMRLIEAAEATHPQSTQYALVAVDGDDVSYAFEGNPVLMAELTRKLTEHIERDINKQ